MHCIQTAERSLGSICDAIEVRSPACAEVAILKDMLATTTIDSILTAGLHEFIDVFQLNLNVVDQSIFTSFFARA
jgi:uncharacterized alpha-E superfamily protein